MSRSAYHIRNYDPQDLDRLVRLGTEIQQSRRTWCVVSPLDLLESLSQPKPFFNNNLFIAERAGDVVGYAEVRPELNIGRVVLKCLLSPKHRRKGLMAKLADHAICRTRELGIKIIHVNVLQNRPVAEHLLTQMGFSFVRRFLEFRLDLFKVEVPVVPPGSLRYGPLQPGKEEDLTRLQNRSFNGSWGYNVNTVEEIIHRIGLPNCSPEDIILAFDKDKPVGYCWTRIPSWENKAPAEGTGRIYMLGVDPDYRGRGIGRQLLLVGLSYLKRKGLRVVELTVDSENEIACTLYRSVGFKPWTSSLWYEKRLEEA